MIAVKFLVWPQLRRRRVQEPSQRTSCLLTFSHHVPLKVMTLLSTDKTTAVFNSIPGQGVIYSVVVRDPELNTSASYVPVHTYACSFKSTLDGCQTLGEIPSCFHVVEGSSWLAAFWFSIMHFRQDIYKNLLHHHWVGRPVCVLLWPSFLQMWWAVSFSSALCDFFHHSTLPLLNLINNIFQLQITSGSANRIVFQDQMLFNFLI